LAFESRQAASRHSCNASRKNGLTRTYDENGQKSGIDPGKETKRIRLRCEGAANGA
jgi:hypothetical protein